MISIIISAHGNFAKELLNSAEMIMGKQENVVTVSFKPGENTENLKEKYNNSLSNFNSSNEVLILVDLFGGSPYNAAFEIAMKNKKVNILTGVNLPMLLDILLSVGNSNYNIRDIINIVKSNQKQYIRSYSKLEEVLCSSSEGDEL